MASELWWAGDLSCDWLVRSQRCRRHVLSHPEHVHAPQGVRTAFIWSFVRLVCVSLWWVMWLLCHQPTSVHWDRMRPREKGWKKESKKERKKKSRKKWWKKERNKERKSGRKKERKNRRKNRRNKDRKKESKKERKKEFWTLSPPLVEVFPRLAERCLLPSPCLHLRLKLRWHVSKLSG